jgi:plastocyanin
MSRPTSHRLVALVTVTLALAFVTARATHSTAQPAAPAMSHDMHAMGAMAHGIVMSDVEMQRAADAWFARHPATPTTRAAATAAFADTFTASGFTFDHAGDPAAIDTVTIFEDETVLWQWVSGSHTVTSGTGSGDLQSGVLFNASLNSLAATQTFAFTFHTAGTYPFYCVFHEFANMKGVVVVRSLSGVTPGAARVAGFVTDPAPVPSRGGVTFRFALATPGRVRAEVFDVRGRRVATALDRMSGAGTFDGAWDGRATGGARVASGVYYLRLEVPGGAATRRVVIAD